MKRFEAKIKNPQQLSRTPIKFQIAVLNIIRGLESLDGNRYFDDIDCFIEDYSDNDNGEDFYTLAVRVDNGEDFETFHFRFNYGMRLMKGEITADIGGYVEEFEMYEYDEAWEDFLGSINRFMIKNIETN